MYWANQRTDMIAEGKYTYYYNAHACIPSANVSSEELIINYSLVDHVDPPLHVVVMQHVHPCSVVELSGRGLVHEINHHAIWMDGEL